MNRLELTKQLAIAGISDGILSFYPTNDKYCVVQDGRKWIVYFRERGVETYHSEFASEQDACAHLFQILLGRDAH